MSKRWLSLVVVAVAFQGSSSRAATPANAAPPTERRLHVASAEASSYLVNDWNKFQENYLPLYVGDDDPKTAWTLKTEGIGEWLRVHVTPMAGATKIRLRVRNGYQKSDKLWAANSRAKGLTVVLLPSKKTVDVELTDKPGWQELAVDQPAGPFEAVELRVRSVYAGKKYDDLCLSDVQLFATATTADNPRSRSSGCRRSSTGRRSASPPPSCSRPSSVAPCRSRLSTSTSRLRPPRRRPAPTRDRPRSAPTSSARCARRSWDSRATAESRSPPD